MARVVFRIRYYSPEDAFLDARDERNLKKIENRNYYSSSKGNGKDYLNYIENGIEQSGGFDYLDYMGSHEKSSGAFDKKGLLDEKGKRKLREELRNTKSVIWDCVISPEEELSKKRLNTYEDAKAVIEKCLPPFLKENGIQYDNVNWYAGLHKNTDNNHIHLSFYELQPMSYRQKKKGLFYHKGNITKPSINNMRIRIEETFDGNEFFFAKYQRDAIREMDETLKKDDPNILLDSEIREELIELYRSLPEGKIGYMSKEMIPLRPLIDDITMKILKKNPDLEKKYFSMKQELKRHDDYIKGICDSQNVEPEKFLLMDKLVNDFHRRCGNKIIDYCRKYQWEVNYDGLSYEMQRKQRNIAKKKRTLLLKKTANLARRVDDEAMDVFEEYEARLRKAEYDRLVEEGEIELE